MASPQVVKASGMLPLSDLQKVVQQNEQILGPLTALGNAQDLDGTKFTLLTLDMAQAPPDDTHLAVLGPCVGGTAPPRAEHTVICTGECYIIGQLQTLAAYRPV